MLSLFRSCRIRSRFLSHYAYEERNDGTIEKKELEQLINDNAEMCIVDVREQWETELGMLPNAKNIPLGQVGVKLAELTSNNNINNNNNIQNRRIIVYCRSGARSQMALEQLEAHGFTNATNYVGSFLDWFPDRYYDIR